MIFSVSTLFLVALVFNAASTLGAPLKYRDTRSVKDQSPDTFGDFPPVALKLRSVSVVSERGIPLVSREEVKPEAREENLVRRYPRRVSYDRFEKREPEPEPATTVQESTVVITKVTTYDTPADAAGNGKPNDSVTSTLLSSGFTTTLAPADPTATPSGVSLTPTTTPTPTVTPVTGPSSPSAVTPTSVPPTSTVADGPTPTATPSGGVVPLSPRSPAEGSIDVLSTLDTAVPPRSQGRPACLSCSAPDPPASSSADVHNGSNIAMTTQIQHSGGAKTCST